jgi:SAM-dependent methyltransferase
MLRPCRSCRWRRRRRCWIGVVVLWCWIIGDSRRPGSRPSGHSPWDGRRGAAAGGRSGQRRAEGLANLEFRLADARSTGLPGGSFDAVVCVFGVFFASNMPAFVAEMWRLVRPGGSLAITTWGPDLFEPANSLFWEAVREVEPSLFKAFNPWDEITTTETLERLLARSGVSRATVRASSGGHDLDDPGGFWDVVLGSGYRANSGSPYARAARRAP